MGIKILEKEYLPVRQLDKDDKGTVEIVRSGNKQYVLRTMNGNISSYPALQKIASPYLPKIEYAAYDGEKTVVLEEYIPGGRDISSLTEEKDIVSAFCQLCDVLEVLHSRGIVHRDIKPSNVLVGPDGNIRLIDFDASRRYDDSKDSDTRYLGTKGYAPPEQFGYSQTNAASDIYSLGVTLKTVLGDKSEKRRFRHIIRKCTEFDPKNRYRSAAGVKRALRNSGKRVLAWGGLCAAAVFTAVLCFLGGIGGEEPENTSLSGVPSESTAAASSETRLTDITSEATTAARTTISSSAPETETAAPEVTEETTEVPVTEETTVIPETEDSSSEETLSETSSAPQTTAASKTTASPKTTAASKTETSAAASSETAVTTASTGLASGERVSKLLTLVTDAAKTPSFSRFSIPSGLYFDRLEKPYEFIPDETVIGTWNKINYSAKGVTLYNQMNYKLEKDEMYDKAPHRLIFKEDGTCIYEGYDFNYYVNRIEHTYTSTPQRWTYGLIETPAIEDYYFYERYYIYTDETGEEYLFIDNKNGDYMNASDEEDVRRYIIYERYKGE